MHLDPISPTIVIFQKLTVDIVGKTYKFDYHELQIELKIFNRMFKFKQTNSNNNIFENKSDFIKQSEIKDGLPLLSKILKLFLTVPTNEVLPAYEGLGLTSEQLSNKKGWLI